MKNRIGRSSASVTACNLVFMPPFVRPFRRPLWSPGPPFSRPQADRRAVRLEIGRVDHHRLRGGGPGCQPVHHSGEYPLVAPTLPAVVEGPWRTIFFGSTTDLIRPLPWIRIWISGSPPSSIHSRSKFAQLPLARQGPPLRAGFS